MNKEQRLKKKVVRTMTESPEEQRRLAELQIQFQNEDYQKTIKAVIEVLEVIEASAFYQVPTSLIEILRLGIKSKFELISGTTEADTKAPEPAEAPAE